MRPRAAALAMVLAAVGAAATPRSATASDRIVATQPDERPAPGTDEAELWYAMERIERDLQQSPLLVRDPALNAYVRSVLCKVTAEYCRDLRVYVVDVPWFNASMAPNGVLIVWTGSLLRIRNEAQLALVLGHEFGHYRERHTLQQWRKLKHGSAILGAFGALATGAGAGVAGMAASLAGMATMMKFTRDKEREADRIGFAQLVAQGYDPGAGVALWDGMLREEEARDYGKPIPVFSTHPQTRERRDDLKAAADAVANPPHELGTGRYRAATRPYLGHWLEQELTRRMFATSIEVIGDLQAQAPAEDAGLYSFYLGEAYRRRGKDADKDEAGRRYALAVTQDGAPPEAWREHGLALRAAGDRAGAAAALRRYVALAPQADDLAFVTGYLTELETRP
jgi:Zn-dependent protease with chaperone function